jgi:hypothetical protein
MSEAELASRGGSSVLGKLVLVGVGVAIGALALPQLGGLSGVSTAVERLYRDLLGGLYSPAACEQDAVGCLRHGERQLQDTLRRIDEAIAQIRPASERAAELIREQERRHAENDLLLREGRTMVQRALDPSAPIRFVGATYPNREALLRQLQVLWSEREAMERFLVQARQQQAALRARHDELLVSRGEVRSALAMIPAQIELARANGVLARVGATLQGIDAAVAAGERHMVGLDTLMRTTQELVQTQQRQAVPVLPGGAAPLPAPASRAAFDAFMGNAGRGG